MSLTKVYAVRTDFYSGFKASQSKYNTFDNILEAFKFYKNSKSHDFDYGDAYHSTDEIFSYFVHKVERTDKIGHKPVTRHAQEFSEEELRYICEFNDDIEDEIII